MQQLAPSAKQSLAEDDGESNERGGFMFVALSGQKDKKLDRAARKSVRAHVMHNFRDNAVQKIAGEPQPTPLRGVGSRHPASGQDRAAKHGTAVVGEKKRFRLRPTGLEETIPYRAKAKQTKAAKTDEQRSTENVLDPRLFDPFKDSQSNTRHNWGEPGSSNEYDFSQAQWQEANHSWNLSTSEWQTAVPADLEGGQPGEEDWPENVPWALPTSPLRPYGKTTADLFNVLPFQMDDTDQMLLDRFQHYAWRSWCPINAKNAWFPVAMGDELVFHATIYHWAFRLTSRGGILHMGSARIFEHKVAAIRMINERLSIPSEAMKDETLAAVAAFANVEIGFGEYEEATRHMDGLQALVEMRGGIENIESSVGGLLHRMIGWNDLNYSERFSHQLRYAKACFWDFNHDLMAGPCFRRDLRALGAAEPRVWEPMQGEIIVLFHDIRQLCDQEERHPLRGLNELDKMTRSDVFHSLERRLRALAQRPDDPLNRGLHDAVWRACAMAGLIYVHHVLRGLLLTYKQFERLVQELQSALIATEDLVEAWKTLPELLLWALTIGFVASVNREEHDWFGHQLAKVAMACSYQTWERYRNALAGFLWVGEDDERRYLEVWENVEGILVGESAGCLHPRR